jgi:transcriptional regulator with GAF, ATPase, and Fis domain
VAIEPSALARSIARLERLDPIRSGLQASLDVCVTTVDELFGVDGAGLMLLAQDEILRYAAASDEPGRQLEVLQEQAGEGPCIDAFERNDVVHCADASADPRYPTFSRIVPGHGIGAVLGVPIVLEGGPIGTLNVYDARPHEWSDAEINAIGSFTPVISTLLRVAARAGLAEETARQLQFALEHRVLIEQAKGILMERDGVDAGIAFERLRSVARSNRLKLAEVARSLIEGRPLERLGG